MASQASVTSSQPDKRHIRLISASAQANEDRVRDILAEDPPWTSATDLDALRQSLQKVAARGKLSIVRFLLQHGAEVNTKRDSETPALIKAAEIGNLPVVRELLAHHADPNARTRAGQTALFAACLRGHNKVVEALLDGGADVDGTDREGRSPLLFLAADKQTKAKWNLDTLQILRDRGADIEVRDQIGRTPLLWAATNGNVALARFLLESRANVAAANNRGRTALHLAAESSHEGNREDIMRLLLAHGANPRALSDGGWTPLHNAAQSGYLPVVALLLEADVDVNAGLTNGMTPMHWAAFNGFEDIVRLLLIRPDVNLDAKDAFDRTPMLCAAEKHHADIVKLLSPARVADRLSPMEERACKAFEATVVDFGQFEKKQLVSKHSVYELLYGWNDDLDKPKVSTLTKNLHYKPDFRWIHLPANNIAWVETLLAKSFIEAGHRDIESFKALEKCFDQQHKGHFAHAHFMRTFCHRVSSVRGGEPERKDDTPLVTLSEEPSEISTKSGQSGGNATSRNPTDLTDSGTPTKSETKKKTKAEQFADNHPRRAKRAKGPPGNPPRRVDSMASISSGKLGPLAWDTARHAASNGKIVLFMPFLHYETDERRQKMSTVIKCVRETGKLVDNKSRDSLLINAYMNSNPPLHPRRTLDQFFYHGIDTSERDVDQVVYRYCKGQNIERKVFMVDQLWLWVIGKDLVISCFPQRWDQPKNDPLNVLDGIIEETNAKTRPPIQSVYDLAMLITSRCSSMFNHSRLSDENYQFLDMFEHSIGVITDRESRLFRRFNNASAQSAQWLQRHRRRRMDRMTPIGMSLDNSSKYRGKGDPGRGADEDDDEGASQYPDALLDIGDETSLLAEIKDIRDELNIIMAIIEAQLQTVDHFEGLVTEELRSEGQSRRATDSVVWDIRRRAGEQKRNLEARQKDIARMDSQAFSLYNSLTDLLDLKQKHSNALEARFAGDQAVIAAKQGQTIMVFTIVTIIFLPLSFIAAFFAINLEEWQQGNPLTIPFVSKYMFGIGLGISVPLVAAAFTVDDITEAAVGSYLYLKEKFNLRERTRRSTAVGLNKTHRRPPSSTNNMIGKGGGDGGGFEGDGLDILGVTHEVEKIDVSKPSFSSHHQHHRHLSPPHGTWVGSRPPVSSSRDGRDNYNHARNGRLSPTSAVDHRLRGASLNSAAGNSHSNGGGLRWGPGRDQDLERGEF